MAVTKQQDHIINSQQVESRKSQVSSYQVSIYIDARIVLQDQNYKEEHQARTNPKDNSSLAVIPRSL